MPTTAKSLPQAEIAPSAEQSLIHSRAVEAVIWGMPAVNFDLLYQATVGVGGGANEVVYWSRLLDWHNQTLTPNPDTLYFFPFFNTEKVGPMVLEIPPAEGGSITGSIDDAWQTAIEDVGPAGADQGKGGKYLILPPGYAASIAEGFIALRARTYSSYAVLRSNISNGSAEEIARAVAYAKQIKLYPLSEAADPPATKFTDAWGKLYDSTIPYDARFFRSLNAFVQREPWLERDRAMIDQLKSIGIEKGKRFEASKATRAMFVDAAAEAHALLEARYQQVFVPPFNEGKHWALPAMPDVAKGLQTDFAETDAYPVDGRGVSYSMAYFSAKHLGQGQFYLMSIVDRDGNALDGGKTYRLQVPAKPPVKLYWSATAYDRATHALIKDMGSASRSSTTPGLQANADGSVDVFFGPRVPTGKVGNWVPTNPGGQFEVLFRFYGPDKPLFDKSWVLPDIEKAN